MTENVYLSVPEITALLYTFKCIAHAFSFPEDNLRRKILLFWLKNLFSCQG